MRKLDLTPYDVGGKEPYNVKMSISNALYNPELRLGYKALLENAKLADKIENANGSVLLEEEEYARIRKAFEAITTFTKSDVGLVKRVMEETPEVNVKEKK
jgi:hypothetical protein